MTNKKSVLADVQQQIDEYGLEIIAHDFERPWGGFFVLDDRQIDEFAQLYFDGESLDLHRGPNSPKILVVGPGEELSWQYHHRRAEIWRVIAGPVGIKTSPNDLEPDEIQILKDGETISFGTETRHRLIGLEAVWGVVAEIWQHTDPNHLSDELDIVRLKDKYSRT